ncbi:aminopeptidase P family protein [Ehrlichia ruminantium]|uniref:Aminopeptidase P family protein n=1 Tax=Ehrlichia ruminantium TaxID=779 RepID=A0AAE6UKT0_EHRRU|nr:aminopeptidase P family protein [Ehrlichia ruminantium]QGR02603.1 aminopeptidase P family protein [Ehrlichia ruminantium]QGR03523.1 aminopeptidase P family protein [Ehrlichia ruminantium]QGR04450.1 aminopeptidase P family protein [Ehrlichia ruminantium]
MENRLSRLISLMGEYGINVLLLYNTDEYQSEYIHENKQRLKWLCGFSGSHATIIVSSQGKQHFFTDGRYTLQAQQELDLNYYQIHNVSDITPWQWCIENLSSGVVVGYESQLFTLSHIKKYTNHHIILKPIDDILIDRLWIRDFNVVQNIVSHDLQYSGVTSYEKANEVITYLHGKDAVLITDTDVISWLLNIRNRDFIFNPSVLSRAILYQDGRVDLFIEDVKSVNFDHEYVRIYHIHELFNVLEPIQSIVIDASTVPMNIFRYLDKKDILVRDFDTCLVMKSKKNDTEISGAVNAHIRDGVAIVNLLYWLDVQLSNNQEITELDVVSQLLIFRQQQDLFCGESFATISGFAENGAVIHYKVSNETNKLICKNGLYLLDSGGQYLDGTTDVTRTIAIGKPTCEQVTNFTLVLKGHIAIAMAIFTSKTTGGMLDILARQYLWKNGLDYQHGTGHGVGSFLSVHEGPCAISYGNNVVLQPNMILSNEPGYYKDGEYGIRIENLMYVEKCCDKFLRFKQLTCVPIDLNLINVDMLSKEEVDYINKYHDFVYTTVAPYLDAKVKDWLWTSCRSIK